MSKHNDELWNKFPEDSFHSQDYQYSKPPTGSGNSSDKGTTEQTTTTDPANSATGSGIEGALGMEYAWDTKAEDRANLDYEAAVLESKANFLTNRQELESQGQQMQQQVDMQKYSQNQSSEKAGWTGGYVLDTERQMAYLKQTIQSQMYGAMELQKYGYDTSLAAARLAYETNKFDLALKYYNDAVSQALSESDRTGYYISPEVKEHLNAYSIASKILEDSTSSKEDKQRASAVLDGIDRWFADNGISKQGVETMAHQEFIMTLQETAKKTASFQEGSTIFQVDLDSFGEVNENGELQYSDDNKTVKTLNFNEMSGEEILAYASKGGVAGEQVLGYIEGMIESNLQSLTTSLKEGENLYSEDIEKTLSETFGKRFNELKSKDTANFLSNFTYSTTVKGNPITISLNDKGEIVYTHNITSREAANKKAIYDRTQKATKNDGSGSVTFTDITTSTGLNYTFSFPKDDMDGNKGDDDLDINIGNKNYDLDVDWKYDSGWNRFWQVNNFGKDTELAGKKGKDAWNHAMSYLNSTYPNPGKDEIVMYGGHLWLYSKEHNKWGYIQPNVGGNKLMEDLKEASSGNTPSRWG